MLFEVLDVARFAAEAHATQRRKGAADIPYINHCLDVAARLAAAGRSDVVVRAGLLHDILEDTAVPEAELRRRFGRSITTLVLEVTDDKALPWAERKARQVAHASALSPEAQDIKLADKASNIVDLVRQPPGWPADRVAAYIVWASRVGAACTRGTSWLRTQLDLAIGEAVGARLVTSDQVCEALAADLGVTRG